MLRFSPNPNRAHLIRWREWESDAFRVAGAEDKPVMLFLAAFWCRYCQRMDEGTFSDRENMALLNAYFVPLRVEYAMRPDIDARYNLNGWPTIAFLTPNGKLLAAANFLPTDEFKEFLLNVYMQYEEHKDELRASKALENSISITSPPLSTHQQHAACLQEITDSILALADGVNGGYGNGQKFIQPEATEFLLSRYEQSNNIVCLDHARLTLERMRSSPIYDEKDGGYFRTTTGADWTKPHREKLLGEHAGLLSNCLRLFQIIKNPDFARFAEEIIAYLDLKLFDSSKPAFFGCEDFLRRETGESTAAEEFFTIIDNCVYTDANAMAVVAYLDAASVLDRAELKARALNILEFLWQRCRTERDGMFHYFDEAPRLPGLLNDQARMGIALLHGFRATGDATFVERASLLAEFIRNRLTSPQGGYYDRMGEELNCFGSPLTLIDQNGVAAEFFLALAEATKRTGYRDHALWALNAFTDNFASWGIHAAPFGNALAQWLRGEELE